jgi:hypothetical protein
MKGAAIADPETGSSAGNLPGLQMEGVLAYFMHSKCQKRILEMM